MGDLNMYHQKWPYGACSAKSVTQNLLQLFFLSLVLTNLQDKIVLSKESLCSASLE